MILKEKFFIREIYLKYIEKTLVEVVFNIKSSLNSLALLLEISEDGETIQFSMSEAWTARENSKISIYRVVKIPDRGHELQFMLSSEIKEVWFGVGTELHSKFEVLYYLKLITDKCNFVFFNNGDSGFYLIGDEEEVIKNDIYGFKWQSTPPMHR